MKTSNKIKICLAIFGICIFLIFGLFGGLEKEYISFSGFIWRFGLLAIVGGAAFYKSGVWKHR